MKIVRLLQGQCITPEGYAMNDFEAMATGDTSTVSGETVNAGCRFDPVTFTMRPQ
jgi:hypothetical protein